MNVAVVAGGTGGHIFPALATIEEMKQLSSDSTFVWITTERGREKDLAEEYNVTPLFLPVEGIRRSISLQPIRAIAKFVRALFTMHKYLKTHNIDRVVAFGGYVCAPVVMAAKMRKIPFFLQEQNSVPGLVNRKFAKDAEKVFLGVPVNEKFELTGAKTELTGTPIRKRKENYDEFNFPFDFPVDEKSVLICGGSQGAVSMNRTLVQAVEWLSENGIFTVWQSGYPGFDEVNNHFKDNKSVKVVPSMDDLYPYYNRVDLLIGRSGASTISEASLFDLPAILIPLPWSAENHQWFNAGYAEEAGWAVRLVQGNDTSDEVIATVKKLLMGNPELFESMKQKANEAARPDAAMVVAKEVLGC